MGLVNGIQETIGCSGLEVQLLSAVGIITLVGQEHTYQGLCIPIMFLLCSSGSLFGFKP